MIIPMLAIAGSLVGKTDRASLGGDVPDRRHAVRRPAVRRHPDHGRTDLLPRSGSWPAGRASLDASRHALLRQDHEKSHLTPWRPDDDRRPRHPVAGDRAILRQARSAADDPQPGDVRRRGRRDAHHHRVRPRNRHRRRPSRLHLPDHPLALGHRAVRQLRRSGRGRPRQGAGRDPAAGAHRNPRPAAGRTDARKACPPPS